MTDIVPFAPSQGAFREVGAHARIHGFITAGAVAIAALPATTAVAAVAHFAAGAAGEHASTGAAQWGACPIVSGTTVDPRQECMSIDVPLDYGAPGGPTISLAVSRIRTATREDRRGVLLLIPGGPGSSGLFRPSAYVGSLPRAVLDRYDLVGFDPRGVGASTPISCGLAPDDAAASNFKPWPAPDGDISANVARARRIADACAANGSEVLRHVSTANGARDMDRIRAAIGEDRLSYWGVSYGTYVGAVYATMFSSRTDRVVLDSIDDPDPQHLAQRWLANYAVGVEDRFPDFGAWAAARNAEYGLGADAAAVRSTFLQLAARLDRTPLPWPGANPPQLTGNVLRDIMLTALYSDESFPSLAGLMHTALVSGTLPSQPSPPDALIQNTVAVAVATICNDIAWPTSIRRYEQDVARNRAAFPLTAGMPVNIGPCSYWHYRPTTPPVRVTSDGPANVLLVQNLRDPATPHSGALKMRQALADRARMISVDSGGHGSYLTNGNACGDRSVTEFLVTGTLPPHDTLCTDRSSLDGTPGSRAHPPAG
jgi:pimeloyl-ACP methyl ester carboxylesterase